MVQYREDGKLITRSFAKKEDALTLEGKVHRDRQLSKAGLERPKDKILFLDSSKFFLKRRYQMVEQRSLTLGTVNQDESRLRNYWLEKFGKRAIQTMTTSDIKNHLDHIQFDLGHSPGDRNRHRALLHTFFEYALGDGKVVYNPVTAIELVTEIVVKKKTVVRNLNDLEKYLTALHNDDRNYGMIGEALLWTGARISEAVALQWRDIDFELGTVWIRRIEERAGKSKIVERTKGGGDVSDDSGGLVVPLFPRYRLALESHRSRTAFARATDFIACRKDGRYIPYDTFKDVHKRAITAAELSGRITPHTLRASFATIAKKSGYTRAELREILGHSTELVTARYDKRDIEHLIEKGKRIGFGQAVDAENVVEMKRGKGK
jgi:integrase/recombinase XerD